MLRHACKFIDIFDQKTPYLQISVLYRNNSSRAWPSLLFINQWQNQNISNRAYPRR